MKPRKRFTAHTYLGPYQIMATGAPTENKADRAAAAFVAIDKALANIDRLLARRSKGHGR